ncbi:MAG: penicillin-binding transpeptidase domain-containing protein [Clostridia bacterium]|nr:penicillin-binding transpeptidase domain-containing protein [Clostridia bacterium]
MKRQFRTLSLAFVLGFAGLMAYLGYFYLARAPELAAHPLNPRRELEARTVNRGGILDRNGEMLAQSRGNERVYPLGPAAAHVIGYISHRHGKTGVEQAAEEWLAGKTGTQGAVNWLRRLIGRAGEGYDVVLTLDAGLQRRAAELLAARRGAVIVTNPATGEVLALVSTPGFDPGRIDEEWAELGRRPDAPLLNRALNGLYPPGSVAKILTCALAVEKDPASAGKHYYCPGFLVVEGRRLNCWSAHGEIDLSRALAQSCNVACAQLALELGGEAFRGACPGWGFNAEWAFDLPVTRSRFPERELTGNALAEAGIGQGPVLVTPFHVAMITAAIANGGVLEPPRLVAARRDPGGELIPVAACGEERRMFIPSVADYLRRALTVTVKEGTGQRARLKGIEVAGKTGSAENPHGPAHAWFTGFAPAGAPRVAVTVLVENGGSGGEVAAPIAGELLAAALRLTAR